MHLFCPRTSTECDILGTANATCQGNAEVLAHAGLGVQVTPNMSTGNGMDFLIGRVSYTFGLTGPCVSTHTACSSSLVSTHLAVHGMAARDCQAAVTAGVFLILLDGTMAGICQLQAWPHLLSAQCFTQDCAHTRRFPDEQVRACNIVAYPERVHVLSYTVHESRNRVDRVDDVLGVGTVACGPLQDL